MHHNLMVYDRALVILSFTVAWFASYTALDMGTRLRRATGRTRKIWLGGSAIVLGGGIWSMHFVAMLACNVGVPVGYDYELTAISLLIAIVIVAIGFHLVASTNPSLSRQGVAGVIVGCGVATMHYTGMSALILGGAIHYDPALVAASILIAVVAATIGLWLTLNLTSFWQRVAAATIMTVAVCGMHYTGMSASSMTILPDQQIVVDPLSRPILAAAVSIGLFLILCLAMVCVFVDRRFEFLADREAENLRSANSSLREEITERQVMAVRLIAANAELTDTQAAIRNLLDNADQGFLTVGSDFLVGDKFSAACEAIFGETPAGKPIVGLLCRDTPPKTASDMHVTLESVFRDSSSFIRDLKIGLLPTTFVLGLKSVKVNYKFLPDSRRLMLILTDMTPTILLTEAVGRERQRLEMIVLALTESAAFAALVNDYGHFIADELPQLLERLDNPTDVNELYRLVHTYKGLLAQFSFHLSARCLHELETNLTAQASWTIAAARETFAPQALSVELRRDLTAIADVLGPDFNPSDRRVTLSPRQLQAMERVAQDILCGDEGRAASAPLRKLLQMLAGLETLDVKAGLAQHSRGAAALAVRLQKQLAPLCVHGDDVNLSSDRYGKFFRSLVHLFRNSVDHGIEAPEDRLVAGKPAVGVICCNIRQCGDSIELLIEDDGNGVDRSALEHKLLALGLAPPQVKDLSLEDLLFCEGLSSRSAVTEISGRGVGLAALKAELDLIAGSVTVETVRGVGTRFRFRLPITPPAAFFNVTTPTERIAL